MIRVYPFPVTMTIYLALFLTTVLITSLTTTPAAYAANATADYTEVNRITQTMASDLEALRRYLGKPTSTLRQFDANSATDRHAFLLAQSVFRKLNVLAQEVAGSSVQSPPAAPNRVITAADVLNVLARARGQLALINDEYDLTSATTEADRGQVNSTIATEQLFQLLRQINLMLIKQYRPHDVYERLDLATVYVAGVLEKKAQPLFPKLEFVPNKQPVEVFRKLLDCSELSASIAAKTGSEAIQINLRRMRNDNTHLSNNYDLATVLLSDIAVWTESLQGSEDVFPEDVVIRHILPSHVYQKAAQLEAQMRQLLEVL